MKSQWKKRKTRKTPPPISKIGLDCSIDFMTNGSELNVAVRASIGESEGFAIHTISQGKSPLTMKTANNKPHNKNHFLAFCDIVERTSAFITALSIEEMVSKSSSPRIVRETRKRSNITLRKIRKKLKCQNSALFLFLELNSL